MHHNSLKILSQLIFLPYLFIIVASILPNSKTLDQIWAGQIHYSRIPVQYWENRIQLIKALGLNSLSVYVMWNYHQIKPGVFDYSSQNKNLPLFLDLAQKHEMKVLIRPGPYVCAQWDFGGLPARLLSEKDMLLRANNGKFMLQTSSYFESLAPILKKHEHNIIMLQIENEYGSFDSDIGYIQALRNIWQRLGIIIPQYYVQGFSHIRDSYWPGANIGINDGVQETQYKYVRSFEQKGFIFAGEIYSGWLTHWSESWKTKTLVKVRSQFQFLLSHNHSFSIYMAHGGTNFGLTSGANRVAKLQKYSAHVTSYDYDAPINQQGQPNQKYYTLRQIFKKHANWEIPDLPQLIESMQIAFFRPQVIGSLTSNLGQPKIINSTQFYPFQSKQLSMFNQGLVIYQTWLKHKDYRFRIRIHDFALLLLDRSFITVLNRSSSEFHQVNIPCKIQFCRLSIIVEAHGHLNYGYISNDYKGLINFQEDHAYANQLRLTWNMSTISIDDPLSIFAWNQTSKTIQPTLLKAIVTVNQEPKDTYLDMRGYKKGYIWVNGHNLGRYWDIGPQYRIFCPGVWLKQGQNIVLILQMLYDYKQKPSQICGKKQLE